MKAVTEEHKHFWVIVGSKGDGPRWFKSHALAKCKYCALWTVVEYGTLGPCKHVAT